MKKMTLGLLACVLVVGALPFVMFDPASDIEGKLLSEDPRLSAFSDFYLTEDGEGPQLGVNPKILRFNPLKAQKYDAEPENASRGLWNITGYWIFNSVPAYRAAGLDIRHWKGEEGMMPAEVYQEVELPSEGGIKAIMVAKNAVRTFDDGRCADSLATISVWPKNRYDKVKNTSAVVKQSEKTLRLNISEFRGKTVILSGKSGYAGGCDVSMKYTNIKSLYISEME